MNERMMFLIATLVVFLFGCNPTADSRQSHAPKFGSGSMPLAVQTAPAMPVPPSGVVLEGTGTAQVDGILSEGEWDGADRVDFDARLPERDGGGTTPATLLAMHDGTHLYFAVRVQRPAYGGVTQPIFEFDNDQDGVWPEPGDDVVHMSVSDFEATRFWDVYRYPCPGSEDPAAAGCSAIDAADGGSEDGTAAASNDGVATFIELSHPLDDGDDAHDFSLTPGAAVGFQFDLHLWSLLPGCNEYAECVADTVFGAVFRVAGGGATALAIDVMPGSDDNPVNPSSHGVIPVAVLGSATFDAAGADAAAACFGDAEAPAERDCTEAHGRGHLEDVNADGVTDLVLHFETAQTGIGAGDTRACLTLGGAEGCDAIRTVGRP